MTPKRRDRIAPLVLAVALSAACSQGGDAPGEPPPPIPPGVPFTLRGTVTYDLVQAIYDPATDAGTLDLAQPARRPVRGARLQVRQGGAVLAETTTDDAGGYAITFTPGPSGSVVVAALAETAAPPIRVEDNTDGDAVWAVGKPMADASPTLDVHATLGWSGAAYVEANRIAAPFAILDTLSTAARRLLAVRAAPHPPLAVHWSPRNFPSETLDYGTGAIFTSHYAGLLGGAGQIYVLGKDGVDTDEFDSHVVVHEWGHFFEDALSRADSPGGSHGLGDVLDPRLAFGEGYGNAIAAMLLADPIYADTYWPDPATLAAFGFDAESEPTPSDDFASTPYGALNPGPFSEMSVLRVLYDLYDDSGAREPWDTVALGLGPIYDTLVGPQRETEALTTLASFVAGLKAQPGIVGTAEIAAIDAVLAERGIGPIADAWGTGDAKLEAMFAPAAPLTFSGSATLDGGYCGDPFVEARNKWQCIQYWVVTGTGGQITATASSTSAVVLEAYRAGTRLRSASGLAPTIQFQSVNGGRYVLVVTGLGTAAGPQVVNLSVTSP